MTIHTLSFAHDTDPAKTTVWREAFQALAAHVGDAHARFMRYLMHRNLLDCQGRKVWGVFGDGEMAGPESMSALTLAARASG